MLKVFYIGKFELFYRTENYVARAFEHLGIEVKKRHITNSMTCNVLLGQIERFNPDVVLFSKSNVVWFKEVIEWCRERGIVTVCWLFDLIWDIPRANKYSGFPQFNCDLFFATDGGHKSQWVKVGANHITLRQGIHLEEAVCFDREEIVHDVGFVGTMYGHGGRGLLMRWLFAYYQQRYKHIQGVRGLALNKVLAQMGVIVGDSYPSPNYWSNRFYEILGRGGMMLHPYTDGLDQEFIEGVHYIGYERITRKHEFIGLVGKIDNLLKTPERIEEVRKNGFEHVRKNYTYTHRVVELLRCILDFVSCGVLRSSRGY